MTGYGISQWKVVDPLTFGLLSKATSQRWHQSVIGPLIVRGVQWAECRSYRLRAQRNESAAMTAHQATARIQSLPDDPPVSRPRKVSMIGVNG